MTSAQMQHQQMLRSQSDGVMSSGGMNNNALHQQIVASQHQQQANNQMGMQLQMAQSQSINSSIVSTG